MAPPRYATPRTPERKTLGPAAARVARLFGFELLEWQRLVLDVALELENGRLVYGDSVVTTPRQSGKTSLLFALWVTRALLWPNQIIRFTAQSGQHARKKLEEGWLPLIEASPIAGHVKVRRQNGSEGITFPNGSRLGLVPTTFSGGHGDVCDLILLDEIFAYADARMEVALRPTTLTRSQPQFWMTSTAGTPEKSRYLLEKVEAGREAATAELNHSLAYFEWSADPEEDPSDVETWRRCMPALGQTVDEAAVTSAFHSMSKREFCRSYLNMWVSTMGDAVIDAEHWATLADADAPRPPWVVIGVDVSPQDRSAAIVAAGEDGDVLRVALLEAGAGTDWLPAALERVCREYGNPRVLLDARACAGVLPQLERASNFRVTELDTVEIAAGCEFFLKLTNESRLRHRGEPQLAVAVDSAAQRPLSDSWAWSRRKSGGDISPLVAATVATSFWLGSWSGGES